LAETSAVASRLRFAKHMAKLAKQLNRVDGAMELDGWELRASLRFGTRGES